MRGKSPRLSDNLERHFHGASKTALEEGHFTLKVQWITGKYIPDCDISDFSVIANRATMKSQRQIYEAILERHFHGASQTALEEGNCTTKIPWTKGRKIPALTFRLQKRKFEDEIWEFAPRYPRSLCLWLFGLTVYQAFSFEACGDPPSPSHAAIFHKTCDSSLYSCESSHNRKCLCCLLICITSRSWLPFCK